MEYYFDRVFAGEGGQGVGEVGEDVEFGGAVEGAGLGSGVDDAVETEAAEGAAEMAVADGVPVGGAESEAVGVEVTFGGFAVGGTVVEPDAAAGVGGSGECGEGGGAAGGGWG